MLRKLIIMMAAFILASLSGCSVDGPVSVIDQDENLSLELILPKSRYQKDEEIICKAVLSYIGEDQTFEFFTGDPTVKIAIGGGKYFKGELDLVQRDVIVSQKIEKGAPVEYPLKKYAGIHLESDEDAVRFWKEYLAQEQFTLPPGKYEIIAKISYTSAKDISSVLTVRHKIQVQ